MQRITIDPSQRQDKTLILTAEQSHYLRRVLRLKTGSVFIVQDGQGNQWQARLNRQFQADLLTEPIFHTNERALILAAALPKQGFDDVVRQATELGVTEIQPLLSERTLLKPSAQKLNRWQRIAQEAAEQSERAIVPQIHSPISSASWLNRKITDGVVCMCVARGASTSLLTYLAGVLPTLQQPTVTIIVGPEGGWTPAEISVATQNQYQIVSLSSAILRATTASIVALSIVTAVIEDFI